MLFFSNTYFVKFINYNFNFLMARKKLERRIKQIIIRVGNSSENFTFDSNEKLMISKEERKRKMGKIKKELIKIRNKPVVEEENKEIVSQNNNPIYVQHMPLQINENNSNFSIFNNPTQHSNNSQKSIDKSELNALLFDENGRKELEEIDEDFLYDLF